MKIFDIFFDPKTCIVYLNYALSQPGTHIVTVCDLYSDCVYYKWKFDSTEGAKFWISPLSQKITAFALNNDNFPGFTVKVYNEELRLIQSQKLILHPTAKPYTTGYHIDQFDPNGPSFADFFYGDLCKDIDVSGVVVDAGANVGFFTLYSKYYGAKRIYSIEPDPSPYFYLQKNFENDSNIVCINKGMNATDSGMNINICLDSSVGTSEFLNIEKMNRVFIPTISIDTLLKIEKEINLIKLDIEGTEFNVIDNLNQTQFSKINQFFIEFHFDPKPMVSTLIKYGYDVEYRHSTENDTVGFIYSKKKK